MLAGRCSPPKSKAPPAALISIQHWGAWAHPRAEDEAAGGGEVLGERVGRETPPNTPRTPSTGPTRNGC